MSRLWEFIAQSAPAAAELYGSAPRARAAARGRIDVGHAPPLPRASPHAALAPRRPHCCLLLPCRARCPARRVSGDHGPPPRHHLHPDPLRDGVPALRREAHRRALLPAERGPAPRPRAIPALPALRAFAAGLDARCLRPPRTRG